MIGHTMILAAKHHFTTGQLKSAQLDMDVLLTSNLLDTHLPKSLALFFCLQSTKLAQVPPVTIWSKACPSLVMVAPLCLFLIRLAPLLSLCSPGGSVRLSFFFFFFILFSFRQFSAPKSRFIVLWRFAPVALAVGQLPLAEGTQATSSKDSTS